MRSVQLGAVLALLAGCSGDPSIAPRAASDAIDPGTDGSAHDEVTVRAGPAAAQPATVELELKPPSNVACAFVSPSWSGDLQLRAGGPVFATIADTKTTLTVPRERAAAFATVDAAITLHGMLSAPRLYLARPMLLGGFIAPVATTPIPAPGPHAEGKLSVRFSLDELVSDPASISQELPCSAIAAMPADYDVRTFLRVPKVDTPDIDVAEGAELHISPQQASPIARLSRARRIWVTAGSSDARRIVLEGEKYFAVGWVATHHVGPRTSGMGLGTGGGRGRFADRYRDLLTCERQLPVFAQINDERARVGTLRAKQGFHRASERVRGLSDEELAIKLPGSWLTLAPGASLFVKAQDLANATCKR